MRYTVTELAAHLNVSRQLVNAHCKKGNLDRDGEGRIDTERGKNRAWVDKRRPPVAAPPPPVEGESLLGLTDIQLSGHTKATIDKLKSMEAMLKIRQEREIKRGNLIDRMLVSSVFGELYTIDANSWKTLGSKVSATVAGICECDDPEKVLSVEQHINEEVTRILQHVKKTLDSALQSWEPK